MERVMVRPIGKTRVLDPQTREPIPASGTSVPLSSYWRRRIRDGAVEIVGQDERPRRRKRATEDETQEQ